MSSLTGLAADIVATMSDADVLAIVAEGAFSLPALRAMSRSTLFRADDVAALVDDVERLCRLRATAGLPGEGDQEEEEEEEPFAA